MKTLIINTTTMGSTGTICQTLNDFINSNGNISVLITGYGKNENHTSVFKEKWFRRNWNSFLTKINGGDGFFNKRNTKNIITYIDSFKPDLINIHNLHGHYINIPMLFNYLSKHNIPVVFTLHDCFIFTGGCSHYSRNKCYKWENNKCDKCAFKKEYPFSFYKRNSHKYLNIKEKMMKKMNVYHFVTPSKWLENEFKRSVFGSYPITTINNGINVSQYEYICKEQTRNGKPKILCSASIWDERKGIDILNDLIEKYHTKFDFFVVGKEDKKKIHSKAIRVGFLDNRDEINKLYQNSDIFFNPSQEENYPTVLIESIILGTPVIAFNIGGSKEIVGERHGVVIDSIDSFESAVFSILNNEQFKKNCLEDKKIFSREKMCQKYYTLFKDCYEKNHR